MDTHVTLTVPTILVRLLGAGIVGALIGYERRMHLIVPSHANGCALACAYC